MTPLGAGIAKAKDKVTGHHEPLPVPTSDGRLGTVDLAKQVVASLGPHSTASFAKAVAFSVLMALFPLLTLVVVLLGLFHADNLLLTAVDHFKGSLPGSAYDLLTQQVIPNITSGHGDAGLSVTAVFAIGVALWGVSGAVRELMNALNVTYDVTESRGKLRLYLTSLALAGGTAVLLLAAMVLVVGGPQIAGWVGDQLHVGTAFTVTWVVLQWPVLAAMVLLAFALVYYVAPDVEQEFRYVTAGSVTALVLWLVFTGLFSAYVNLSGSYAKTYGALAGMIVLLLYLNYSAMLVLIGAEVNAIVEAAAPGGKARGAKVTGWRRLLPQRLQRD